MNCYGCGQPFLTDDHGNPEYQVMSFGQTQRKVCGDCVIVGPEIIKQEYLAWCEANGVQP
jgi:hypothetical protein